LIEFFVIFHHENVDHALSPPLFSVFFCYLLSVHCYLSKSLHW